MVVKLVSALVLGALIFAAIYLPKPDETTSQLVENEEPVPPIAAAAIPDDSATETPDNPVELGSVHWSRDLDASRAKAKISGKPLLILFQEVPGCGNCTRYGSVTLRHPLIVEAIETYFEPVCIYNNKDGKDAEALRLFGEAAWNNPVVRIVGADNRDLVERMPDFRSSGQLVDGIRAALGKTGQAVPVYLELLSEELKARETGIETATFTMGCFWTGEGALGNLPGVIETAPGYQDGREVVRVTYDPARVTPAQMEKTVQSKGIKSCNSNTGFRTDREPKYYLSQTHWRGVPMTSLQACRANSLVGQGQSPENILSPCQLELGRRIQSQPELGWANVVGTDDLAGSWEKQWQLQ